MDGLGGAAGLVVVSCCGCSIGESLGGEGEAASDRSTIVFQLDDTGFCFFFAIIGCSTPSPPVSSLYCIREVCRILQFGEGTNADIVLLLAINMLMVKRKLANVIMLGVFVLLYGIDGVGAKRRIEIMLYIY